MKKKIQKMFFKKSKSIEKVKIFLKNVIIEI